MVKERLMIPAGSAMLLFIKEINKDIPADITGERLAEKYRLAIKFALTFNIPRDDMNKFTREICESNKLSHSLILREYDSFAELFSHKNVLPELRKAFLSRIANLGLRKEAASFAKTCLDTELHSYRGVVLALVKSYCDNKIPAHISLFEKDVVDLIDLVKKTLNPEEAKEIEEKIRSKGKVATNAPICASLT